MSEGLPRILLVEDSPTDVLLVKHVLRRDYEVDVARDAAEAMERLQANSYQIVIIDYCLPTVSGLDLLAWMGERGVSVPVVVMSSQGDERVAAGALKQGAHDYVIKTEDSITSLPVLLRQALRRFELEQRNRMLTQIVESANDVILTVDSDGRVTTANQAVQKAFGWEPSAVAGRPISDLFPVSFPDNQHVALALAVTLEGRSWRGEVTALRRDGVTFPAQLSTSLLRDRERGPKTVIAIVSDVSERRQLMKELERLSITDDLTGLNNYRFFQDRLRYEYLRAARYAQQLGCIMLDIDYFKSVNDTYGHQTGDEVLKALAKLVRGATRDVDIVARYGGEEFAVLLPNTDGLGTRVCAEHVWRIVGGTPIRVGNVTIRVQVSVGASTLTREVDDAEELLRRADQALYVAKRRGRNNVCLWEEIRESPRARDGAVGRTWTVESVRRRLRQLNLSMKSRYIETFQPVLNELTAGWPFLTHHATNVAIYAVELGVAAGLREEEVEAVRVAAIFHDIGMVAVPGEIIEKPGPLTPEERKALQQHVVVGEMLASELPFLGAEPPLIRHHHERFDGTGAPDGLAGERIPLGARILSVADAYDAMLSARPHRKALSSEQALAELRRCAGSQFDPALVETFVRIQRGRIRGRADSSGGPGKSPPGGTGAST